MSEDALHKLIDELKENGASAEVSELKGGKNGEIQKVLGISVKIDFSEHDKVFEDKIEDLESLMQKRDEFLEMKNIQIAELKRRIAELESKKTQNSIKGWICVVAKEINGQEYVRLEDFMSVVNDLQTETGT